MSEPIRQHYVPRLYLKKFAFADKKGYYVYALRKSENKIIKVNINNVAVENNFYTVEKFQDKYSWEKLYANNIEPSLKELLDDVIEKCESNVLRNDAVVIDEEQKIQFAIHIVYQLMRSIVFRKKEEEIYETHKPLVMSKVKEHFPEIKGCELKRKIEECFENEDFFKTIAYDVTFDTKRIGRFAEIIFRKAWIFYVLDGNRQFVTSDNPVMFIDSNTLDPTPFRNGLVKKDTVIYFPISKKIMLAIYSNQKYFGLMNNMDRQRRILSCRAERKYIDTVNLLQYQQCNEFAISYSESELKKILY